MWGKRSATIAEQLSLEPRDLRTQRGPGGALVVLRRSSSAPAADRRDARIVTASDDLPVTWIVPIDDLLLVVGHTRLLSGRGDDSNSAPERRVEVRRRPTAARAPRGMLHSASSA